MKRQSFPKWFDKPAVDVFHCYEEHYTGMVAGTHQCQAAEQHLVLVQQRQVQIAKNAELMGRLDGHDAELKVTKHALAALKLCLRLGTPEACAGIRP